MKSTVRLAITGKTLVEQIEMSLEQQYGQCNKKDKADWQMIGKHLAMKNKSCIRKLLVSNW